MAHLPELALVGGAARGARGALRERMNRVEREVAADVAQLAGVDVVLLDLLVRGDVELAAERALQVGELDHRQRRVGLAEHEAGDGGELDVIVDGGGGRGRDRPAGLSAERAGELLEQLPDRLQLLQDLIVLLLQRLRRDVHGREGQRADQRNRDRESGGSHHHSSLSRNSRVAAIVRVRVDHARGRCAPGPSQRLAGTPLWQTGPIRAVRRRGRRAGAGAVARARLLVRMSPLQLAAPHVVVAGAFTTAHAPAEHANCWHASRAGRRSKPRSCIATRSGRHVPFCSAEPR